MYRYPAGLVNPFPGRALGPLLLERLAGCAILIAAIRGGRATKALLVIDILRDFLNPDGTPYRGDRARSIIALSKGKWEKSRGEAL